MGIGNVTDRLPIPLIVSPINYFSDKNANQETEIQNLYDRVRPDMIDSEIKGSITKTSLKKLRLHHGEYEWTGYGGLVRNDGHNMICLILKIINTDTRIGFSNLKYEIEKATLAKFGNNVKYLLDDMSSN